MRVHCENQRLPIGRCGKPAQTVLAYIAGNERLHRVTEKDVGVFDTSPEALPNMLSGAAVLLYQIISDLNVTAEDDRTVGGLSFGNWDQRRHLRVVDDDHISASVGGCSEWPSLAQPISFRVANDPFLDLFELFVCCANAWWDRTL